ncbi:MAG: BMP family ABC transporter substrate-binding protein [Firmicutes bacterium]|nr:BMP family ABC transporter substrate-binding protein [Bacillota bacterium]
MWKSKLFIIPMILGLGIFLFSCVGSKEYTISFESNGGSEVASIISDGTTSFTAPQNPIKEGYLFDGWYSDAAFESIYNFKSIPSENLVLYAKWDLVTYDIYYVLEGGNNSLSNPYHYTMTTSTIILENANKEGYTFLGWFDNDNLSGDAVTEIEEGTTGDITLYAKFELSMGIDIALITDGGSISDESYNQAVYEGMYQYAVDNGKTFAYYIPEQSNTADLLAAIIVAISDGADIVVLPGFLFEVAAYYAQDLFPDVTFILIDGYPHDDAYVDFKIGENTLTVYFNESQAGFLAGYAAVMEGNTHLGFMGGMPVPMVISYGMGYIYGAYYAADELDVTLDFDDSTYTYLGSFSPSQEFVMLASNWYQAGTEVIFGVSGGANLSIIIAAEIYDRNVIGVDVDMSSMSDVILTSAIKNMSLAAYVALDDFYKGILTTGVVLTLGALDDGIIIPFDTSRFDTFTQAEYDAIYADLVDGTIVVPTTWNALAALLTALGIEANTFSEGNVTYVVN